ncbi:hypothetical protein [Flavivirga jejuensis]|uniref:Uncharacterized protein n=1 Tax=Flavivirga jejuensis TaxID=870487 RepID=A0ABT8WRP4_9FLAO|nr:hypothetical protein [Flavivirga jejuensis]MDO5975581.1 hypothetical protein [Flavivirga jejuensis]
MKEKIKYIELLIEKKKDFFGGLHDIYIHSILNTIDLNQLITFYLKKEDSELKKSIESNIIKRLEIVDKPELQYEKLLLRLKNANYHTRQRIKNLQFSLLNRLSKNHYQDFFNTYFYSKYYYENTIALSICDKIWSDDLKQKLLDKFLEKRQSPYLATLLENGKIDYIIPYLEKLLSHDLENYLKMKIINMVSPKHFNNLAFLKEREPEKYFYAMSLSKKKFSLEEITLCFNEIDSSIKHFGLMSLGRLKQWGLLKIELNKTLINVK